MNSPGKCVLAYSGGLDTSAIVPWLVERGYEVHAVLVDVGQNEDLEALCSKALRLGAQTAVIRDARPLMFAQVIPLAIGLSATYEGAYRLGTALSRPFIALEQVRRARELGGATLVHGATGKGNDQIRFEFAYRSLAPDCPVLAPWKVWSFTGRRDLINYLQEKGFNDEYAVSKRYSLDENLWHLSIEGGELEDPEATVDVPELLVTFDDHFSGESDGGLGASDSVRVTFDKGVPVALNDRLMPLAEIIAQLNGAYRQAPWAWDLVIENRYTGIKSRGLYINPAAALMHTAVDALARTCLNKPMYEWYRTLGQQYGTLLYRGEFFAPQHSALESAGRDAMRHLSGVVTVRTAPILYAARIEARAGIFKARLASFEDAAFTHQDAIGFIRLSWLGTVGKPLATMPAPKAAPEHDHDDLVEKEPGPGSTLRDAQPLSGSGLVSASI